MNIVLLYWIFTILHWWLVVLWCIIHIMSKKIAIHRWINCMLWSNIVKTGAALSILYQFDNGSKRFFHFHYQFDNGSRRFCIFSINSTTERGAFSISIINSTTERGAFAYSLSVLQYSSSCVRKTQMYLQEDFYVFTIISIINMN